MTRAIIIRLLAYLGLVDVPGEKIEVYLKEGHPDICHDGCYHLEQKDLGEGKDNPIATPSSRVHIGCGDASGEGKVTTCIRCGSVGTQN
jgi:hypothetical protein